MTILTNGLDWSSWNTISDFQAVKNDPANYKFVFIKATEGTGYKDPYQARWNGAGSIGLLRSCYHFYRQAASPSYQAAYFTGWATKGELPPVLDFEDTSGLSQYGGQAMLNGAKVWLSEMERLWGVKPIVYTGMWFLQLCWNSAPISYDSRWLANYPLWIANYTGDPQVEPLRPSWWPWTFYQWTSSGAVPGQVGRADLNVFKGSVNELYTWAGLTPPQQEGPTDKEKLDLVYAWYKETHA